MQSATLAYEVFKVTSTGQVSTFAKTMELTLPKGASTVSEIVPLVNQGDGSQFKVVSSIRYGRAGGVCVWECMCVFVCLLPEHNGCGDMYAFTCCSINLTVHTNC